MAMEITSNYGSYAAQTAAEEIKKKETAKAAEPTKTKAAQSGGTQAYINQLQKQVPGMILETGSSLSMARDQRMGVVTIHPKLLEKMQNDPEAEEKYTQLLGDIERAEKAATAYYNATGGCVERTSHWYIDENGKYYHFAYTRRDDKLNKKLREESQKNAEKQIEKARERSRKKAEEIQEKLEQKIKESAENEEKSAKNNEKTAENEETDMVQKEVERVLSEKLKHAKDGEIYLNGEDMQPILEAIQEGVSASAGAGRQPEAGANMDLHI